MADIPFDVSWRLDADLHDAPNDPASMRQAVDFLREQAQLAGDDAERARYLGDAGGYARMLGDPGAARALLTSAVAHARAAGQRRLVGELEVALAHALQADGAVGAGEALFQEVLERCGRLPELDGLAGFAHQHRGQSLLERGRAAAALVQLERALALHEARGDREGSARTRRMLDAAQAALGRDGRGEPRDGRGEPGDGRDGTAS